MGAGVPIPHVEGVEHRHVVVDGLRIHVAEAGEGPPLVLQHGWPEHWWEWRHLIGDLARDHRVICPDLRGFGWSEAPADDDYLKERLADDVVALLGVLGHERVPYVGHDWGGWIGFLLGLRRPDLIERMVVLSVPHPWPPPEPPDPRRLARFAYQIPIAAPLPRPVKVAYFGEILRRARTIGELTGEERETYLRPLSTAAGIRASTQMYRQFTLREMPALIKGRYREARLAVPTLLLYGKQDLLYDEEILTTYQDHADDMRHEVFPEAGHFLPEELPEAVLERVRGFLA